MIYFGGSDPDNLTGFMLSALSHDKYRHLAVDVVLGVQCADFTSIQNLASKRPLTTLHSSLPSLCGLIARADLCIGGGGSTTWERASLHLPSIVISLADNQVPISSFFAEDGFCVYAGTSSSITTDAIHSHIDQFLSSQKLSTMSLKLSSAPFGTSLSSLVDHLSCLT